MASKNRTDLKSFFVKNAIPTEGNFADLIDSALNQAADSIFKLEGEPLSIVAAAATQQKRALRLYANYPAANPDWMIALNPTQGTDVATARPGLGFTDGAGNTRLFIDSATGSVGVGTNTPQFGLDVLTGARAQGFRSRYDLVLSDYRTANPASNVLLHSPPADRDAWIFRDMVDTGSNWGIYHRQIDSTVAGLPANSIGFVGGGGNKLQAYVSLMDGTGYFAGALRTDVAVGIGSTQSPLPAKLSLGMDPNNTKLALYDGPGDLYGFGIQSSQLRIHVGHANARFSFLNAPAGTEVMTILGTGQVGIGTTSPAYSLTIAGTESHLQLRREKTETAGGKRVYLELYQDDPSVAIPVVYPSIRFHHNNRFWHRLEAREDGLHVKEGHLPGDGYVGIKTGSIGVTGEVRISGTLGTNGFNPSGGLPSGWGGGVHTWDIAVEGSGRAKGGFASGGWDLAEKFNNHDRTLEPGDVVVADLDAPERLIPSERAYQENLLGVISENPGFLLGVSWEDPRNPTALALSGRVPVKVNAEGGPIKIGDFLTSSSERGHAMKAGRSGRVIGMALEAFDGTKARTGKVVVFINPHFRTVG